ncbi:ferric reductase like transmembrane component-domain-containing protein [Xylariaceae sp. FL0804]|nr:ferric reductase like transmembrane component-domain-containing protein [Xylariaceae sp. FL0804]
MAGQQPQQLAARHIQNFSEAEYLEPHWGYYERSLPCTNDAGSCAYLDQVYASHDRSMLYAGILWSTLGGILFLWAMWRRTAAARPSSRSTLLYSGSSRPGVAGRPSASAPAPALTRARTALAACARRLLLPDVAARPIFGRTTRLQVLILAVLAGYLLMWSFVGIAYQTWITPVEGSPGLHNIRTSLGPWSDRVGVLAYALTPLSVLLGSRESVLSLLTGVPYQSFNFLHRWLGYVILAQGALHTAAWTVVEVRLYQPQPATAREWIAERYMVWGVVAMVLLLLLGALSTPWAVRRTGYEFFRKAHYVLAMVYVGACWGHWKQLRCFLAPALAVWALDRAVRLARTLLLHYQYIPGGGGSGSATMGLRAARASLTRFPDPEHGDVVRMDLAHNQDPWRVGQHFYVCFAERSVWQSHPFTPLNLPRVDAGGCVRHAYVFRAKRGETRKVADLAAEKLAASASTSSSSSSSSSASSSASATDKGTAADPAATTATTTPLILTGPYGEHVTEGLAPDANVLCVAGGTGISYVLPVLLELAEQPLSAVGSEERRIQLVWAVRREEDLRWVEPELGAVRATAKTHRVEVRIFVTREAGSRSRSPSNIRDGEKSGEAKSSNHKTKMTADTTSCCCATPSPSSSSSSSSTSPPSLDVQKLGGGGGEGEGKGPGSDSDSSSRHPDLGQLVRDFVQGTVRGPTRVFASGPGAMLSDLRRAVAACNDGAAVWRGDERRDVDLTCDDRLEW